MAYNGRDFVLAKAASAEWMYDDEDNP